MSEELKPCPFCGGSAKLEKTPSGGYFHAVSCEDCFADGPWFKDGSYEEKINAWNERHEKTN